MNSDDEKRLAEIRARIAEVRASGWLDSGEETSAEWLLAKLDESERVRRLLEESLERGGAGRCGCDHAPCRHDAHRFLAEREEAERARKTAEATLEDSLDNHHRAQLSMRVQKAEAALAEARRDANRSTEEIETIVQSALAEERAKREADNAKAIRQENRLARWVTEATERAEAAEARVRELESAKPACVDLRHVCGGCGFQWPERSAYDELTMRAANAEARVRELEVKFSQELRREEYLRKNPHK